MRWWINSVDRLAQCCLLIVCGVSAAAGPVDFGLDEYNAAIQARHVKWKIKCELTADPPETYRIEPYAVGGAHITGGDLRGLMYGLLEAADQIRAAGRMKPAHAEPATPVRGVRRFASAADMEAPEAYWRAFFEMLARDRFNRFTLIFTSAPGNLEKLRAISQMAADYAVDFTLGLWEQSPGNLAKLVSACPLIRSVEVLGESGDVNVYRNALFRPLRDAGHRIALDPRGKLAQPEFLKAARAMGVALRFDSPSFPPSFDLDLPREFETHAELYWLWGRAAYDRKLKPAHGENPEEFQAAERITTLLAEAQAADPAMFTMPEDRRPEREQSETENDWIATIGEAVRNRLEHSASAKWTPPEIDDALLKAAALLEKSSVPDFQLLAKLAKFHAHHERAAYELELFDRSKDGVALDRAERELNAARELFDVADSRVADRRQANGIGAGAPVPPPPKRLPRPQIVHVPVKTAAADQPIHLTLQLSSLKEIRTVRLHYRPADSAALTGVIEKPAAASTTFEIPGASSDLIYYFEILNRENSGWFEPDPEIAKPYYMIRVEQK